jgi:hypothetical protein
VEQPTGHDQQNLIQPEYYSLIDEISNYQREYYSLAEEVREEMSYNDYCNLRMRNRPRGAIPI